MLNQSTCSSSSAFLDGFFLLVVAVVVADFVLVFFVVVFGAGFVWVRLGVVLLEVAVVVDTIVVVGFVVAVSIKSLSSPESSSIASSYPPQLSSLLLSATAEVVFVTVAFTAAFFDAAGAIT